jgi:hypothetical protein
VIVLQQKTQRPVQFEITPPTREVLTAWIKEAGLKSDNYLFPSRIDASSHVGTRQYGLLPVVESKPELLHETRPA